MKKSRCLGLVGGLGVGATVHYYQALAEAHEKLGRVLDIVIAHAETSRVFEYVQAGDREGLSQYLCGFIQRLKAAGAKLVAIPAVTPHFCIRELMGASALPVLNIFEPLVNELEARSAQRIAVFGTSFVMESRLFGLAGNVEIIPAKPDEAKYIHETYVEIARRGRSTDEQHRTLTTLGNTLRQRERIDLIVLAGTDLALVFNPANTDFPYIDCAALHLRAILRELTGQEPVGTAELSTH